MRRKRPQRRQRRQRRHRRHWHHRVLAHSQLRSWHRLSGLGSRQEWLLACNRVCFSHPLHATNGSFRPGTRFPARSTRPVLLSAGPHDAAKRHQHPNLAQQSSFNLAQPRHIGLAHTSDGAISRRYVENIACLHPRPEHGSVGVRTSTLDVGANPAMASHPCGGAQYARATRRIDGRTLGFRADC